MLVTQILLMNWQCLIGNPNDPTKESNNEIAIDNFRKAVEDIVSNRSYVHAGSAGGKITKIINDLNDKNIVGMVRFNKNQTLLHVAGQLRSACLIKLLIKRYKFNPLIEDGDGNKPSNYLVVSDDSLLKGEQARKYLAFSETMQKYKDNASAVNALVSLSQNKTARKARNITLEDNNAIDPNVTQKSDHPTTFVEKIISACRSIDDPQERLIYCINILKPGDAKYTKNGWFIKTIMCFDGCFKLNKEFIESTIVDDKNQYTLIDIAVRYGQLKLLKYLINEKKIALDTTKLHQLARANNRTTTLQYLETLDSTLKDVTRKRKRI